MVSRLGFSERRSGSRGRKNPRVIELELYYVNGSMQKVEKEDQEPNSPTGQLDKSTIYTHFDDSRFMRGRYAHAGSKESLAYAYDWLKTCISSHKFCQRLDEMHTLLPRRVIDVGGPDNNPSLNLSLEAEKGHGSLSAIAREGMVPGRTGVWPSLLTLKSDRLPAIAALAKVWQRHPDGTERSYRSLDANEINPRWFNSKYPSWAWISCDWAVTFPGRRPDVKDRDLAHVDDVQLHHKSGIYGEVESGSIVLTAHCYFTSNVQDPEQYDPLFPKFQSYLAKEVRLQYEYRERHEIFAGQLFAVLLMISAETTGKAGKSFEPSTGLMMPSFSSGYLIKTEFLILQTIQHTELDRRGQPTKYRRVGRLTLYCWMTREERPINDRGTLVLEMRKTPWPRRILTIV
ncbi:hypothetical protein VTL71DRAFT_15230 [Oculimacula yallundae]|uniref:Uncharacterized protein n=1 Tax=Oculimacula yallundae TaxID=86028 RepID=A0ABR4CGQ4_9HELO